MLKILQVRLQQYMNWELPDVQGGLRKVRRTRDQIANICWTVKKAREFQRNIYFCLIDYINFCFKSLWLKKQRNKKNKSLWLCGSQQTEKFLKRWEYQITLSASWEICMQVKKQQIRTGHGTTDWFPIEKGIHKDFILSHLAYLTYMQSTSYGMPDWMKHKLESRLLQEISIASDM